MPQVERRLVCRVYGEGCGAAITNFLSSSDIECPPFRVVARKVCKTARIAAGLVPNPRGNQPGLLWRVG